MDLQLAGKVALVTGASRGIGRAIAETLAVEGMRVALPARSAELLVEVAAALPTEALAFPCDLREPERPAELITAPVARFGRLDLLVNNAGATVRGDFLALPDAEWQDGFALKFYGAMRCARAAWPHLRVARFGEPAEIARVVAFLGSPAASYCQGVVLDVDGGQTRTL